MSPPLESPVVSEAEALITVIEKEEAVLDSLRQVHFASPLLLNHDRHLWQQRQQQ